VRYQGDRALFFLKIAICANFAAWEEPSSDSPFFRAIGNACSITTGQGKKMRQKFFSVRKSLIFPDRAK
jgi:hypothetical protein